MQLQVAVVILLFAAVSLAYDSDRCPDPSDPLLDVQPYTEFDREDYDRLEKRMAGPSKTFPNYRGILATDDKCGEPDFPRNFASGCANATLATPSFTSQFQAKPVTTCDPCPWYGYNLYKFFGKCYVFAPHIQQVTYVRCQRRNCFEACNCPGSYCRSEDYHKIWFLSYCFGPGPLPGGYQPGFNYRYLWLSQDCTCHNV